MNEQPMPVYISSVLLDANQVSLKSTQLNNLAMVAPDLTRPDVYDILSESRQLWNGLPVTSLAFQNLRLQGGELLGDAQVGYKKDDKKENHTVNALRLPKGICELRSAINEKLS